MEATPVGKFTQVFWVLKNGCRHHTWNSVSWFKTTTSAVGGSRCHKVTQKNRDSSTNKN